MAFSANAEKTPPSVGQTSGRRAVTAIAIGQVCGSVAAAKQEALLALGAQNQRVGAVGCAVGHFGGMPAATQAMGFTGLDQANFGEDGERIIGHGGACVAWMKSGLVVSRRFSRIASGLRALPPSPASGRRSAGRYAAAFSPPTLGRCGTCASSRRLPATRPGARSSARRGTRAPGAAS